jgi:TPR repeat protein
MEEALRWYEAAGAQGDPGAMFALAFLYEGADGVPPDPAKVLRWYAAAAEGGAASAQFHLGLIYEEGRGTPRSLDRAVMWYSLAAAQRHGLAAQALNDLRRALPAAQLMPGLALADAWRRHHAGRVNQKVEPRPGSLSAPI